MNNSKLRVALREKYGKYHYRIKNGEVHIYSIMPNTTVTGWWLMGDVVFVEWRMNIEP